MSVIDQRQKIGGDDNSVQKMTAGRDIQINNILNIQNIQNIPSESIFWNHLKKILKNRKDTIFIHHRTFSEHDGFSLSARFMECVNGMLAHMENGNNAKAAAILCKYMRDRAIEDINFKNEVRDAVANVMSEFDEKGRVSRGTISDALQLANQLHLQSTGFGFDGIYMAVLEALVSSEAGRPPMMYVMAENESSK